MPFIDLKITEKITDEKKESLKRALGEKIYIMHKPESYLMVGIADGYDLYFAGKKLDKGAYVSVSLFGEAKSSDCKSMTAAVCSLLKEELGIDAASVYVTYHDVENWGWNGRNF